MPKTTLYKVSPIKNVEEDDGDDSELENVPKAVEIPPADQLVKVQEPERNEILKKAREAKQIKAAMQRKKFDEELGLKEEAKEIMRKELEKAMKKEARKLTKAFGAEMVYGAHPELVAPAEVRAEYNKKTRKTSEPVAPKNDTNEQGVPLPPAPNKPRGRPPIGVKEEAEQPPTDISNIRKKDRAKDFVPPSIPVEVKRVQQEQPARPVQMVSAPVEVKPPSVRVSQPVQQAQPTVNPYAQRLQQLQRMRGLASSLGL